MATFASFGEGLAAAESAAAALPACDDMDEALRIFHQGEAGLRYAKERLAEVEEEFGRLSSVRHPLQPTDVAAGGSYSDCLRAADEATAALGTCKDAEKALQLFQQLDASLGRAEWLLGQVEGAMRRVGEGDDPDQGVGGKMATDTLLEAGEVRSGSQSAPPAQRPGLGN